MIELKAHISKVSTLKNGTVKVVLDTVCAPDNMEGKYFNCLLSENEISEKEREMLTSKTWGLDDFPDIKSPSMRLRYVLFRLYEQDNRGFDDEEKYYRAMMNNIVEFYKGKLL